MASEVQWIAVCQALLSLVEVELVYVVGRLSCELTGLLHTGGHWRQVDTGGGAAKRQNTDIKPTDCGPKTDGQ